MGRQKTGRARRASTRRIVGVVIAGMIAVVGGSTITAAISAAPAGATAEKTERAQDLELLASIPQSSRPTCHTSPVLPTDAGVGPQAAHVIASLTCISASGDETIFYTRFDDATSMNAAFDGYTPEAGNGSDCPGSGTWDQDDEDAGRWACYLADNGNTGATDSATILWTHDATNTLSTAYRKDSDLAALDDWWSSDDAGPLAAPDHDGLPKVLTTTQWLANGKALKPLAPKSIRSTCSPLPLTEDALGPTFYNWRPWMLGGIQCTPDGVGPVKYLRFAPAVSDSDGALRALAANLAARAGGTQPQVHSGTFSCPGTGSWSRAKHTTGTYACFTETNDSGQFFGLGWTDDAQSIFAYSSISGADAQPLLDFWVGDSGPLEAK